MTTRSGQARLVTLAALAALPLAALGAFFVLPVGGMLAQGFWIDGRFDLGGFLDVLARPRVRRVAWFTLWSSAAGTAASVLLGLPAAYAVHRLAFPGRRLVRALITVPFVLPTVVVGVAIRRLLAEGGSLGFLGLDGTPVAIVAGLVFFNIAVVVRTVGAAWEALDPRPGQAAAALGATPLQVLRTVTLPALQPAIVAASSVVFLFCATAFGVVLTLGGLRYATVETEIYLLTVSLLDLRAAAALSLVQIGLVVGLLWLTRRSAAPADRAAGAVPQPPRRPLRSDLPTLLVTGVVVAFVGTPLAGLVVGSLRDGSGWTLRHYALAEAAGAATTSLRTAVDATWMSVGLGLLVAVVVTRRSRGRTERRLRSALDGLFLLPLGVSAVTLGFGFLITLDEPPLDLRDSPLLVPIAQALVALPLVVRTLTPVLGGVDDRQRQAAASLGASPWRCFVTVELPVTWRPLLAAAGLAFAVSLGEFGATSFLARDDRPTLPVLIYRLFSIPGTAGYGQALAASVLLVGLTAVVMLAVERLRVTSLGML